jgi:hypothetical protein
MSIHSNIKQLYSHLRCSLLIAVITVCCLKMSLNTPTARCWENLRSYQLIYTPDHNNPISYTLSTTPDAYDFVLKQVIDGQVYTPNKMQGKASNIKNNLSLARLLIVTAAC